MKAYIIALQQLPQSMESANRAHQTALAHGLESHIFQGIFKDESRKIAINLKDQTNASNHDAVIGCFLSHFHLWEKCISLNEPIVIMEHDALITAALPTIPSKWDIVNIGKPSYNKLKKPKRFRYLWSKIKQSPIIIKHFSMSHLPGAHAYYITPKGAQQLASTALKTGVIETDHFVNRERFPHIGEVYPWVAVAAPCFSSIQNAEGAAHQHELRKQSHPTSSL